MSRLIYNTSTSSKRSLWPPETAGLWVEYAYKSVLGLSNGKEYDDWASALGANTLGYNGVRDNVLHNEFQPATSLPWQIEHDFAEEFCQAMNTEAVRFAKSGSDATNMAVRLARAFTGRDLVVMFKECYHGTGSEFKPIAWHKAGYIDTAAIALPFGKELIKANYSDVAAIILEPAPKAILLPPDGWLQHLREVCDQHGILLISDQVILGFRHHLSGYPGDSSVRFDLSCYGKAMGQGAAISACTGRHDVMSQLVNIVHFSGTNNGEPLPLQIAQWTLKEYLEKDICKILNEKGAALKQELWRVGFETRGLDSRFEVIIDPDNKMNMVRYCFERGILMPGFCSMAVSHSYEQITHLVNTMVEWRNQNG